MALFVQALVIIFAAFALSRAVLRLKGGELTFNQFFFWAALWIVAIIVAVSPDLLVRASTTLGIGRGVDLALYASIIILFYLNFKLLVRLDNIEQQITTLARNIALRKK